MQYGSFMMPMHLPEKPLAQAFKVGGFGHLLMLVYDREPRQKMLTALELLAKEVMPKLGDLS